MKRGSGPKADRAKTAAWQQRGRETGLARGKQRRAQAGIPDDAPQNAHGTRCVEKTCVVCGTAFLAEWGQRKERVTCSRKCAHEKQRAAGGEHRKGRANPNFKHGSRTKVRNRDGERRWYGALEGIVGCAACGGPGGVMGLSLHHIVYQQHVRRAGGDEWDPRNALALCNSCHMSHHRRGRVLPVSLIPETALAFAADLLGAAAENYFARYYAPADPAVGAQADHPIRRAYEC